MQISIIGAGSVGLLFAAYLAKAGHKITIYTRSKQQSETINKEGITLYYNGNEYHLAVKADVLTSKTILSHSFVIIAVKQYHLENIFPLLKSNEADTAYLFIQNGMGHLPLIKTLNSHQLFVGVIEHGALKKSLTEVYHTGEGVVKISPRSDKVNEKFKRCIDSWHQDHFPIEFSSNWYELLANKLVVNAVINPLTALLDVKNGELLHNHYFFHLMKQLYDETVSVLDVRKNELWDHVQSVCSKTADNQSSMLRDIQRMRKTEIEAINGYILTLAKERGKILPHTEFVVNMIKGLESRNDAMNTSL